ncbi:MAG TPA: TcpQ domain-containing protein [Burkholderiaceae bacterium]|nr:TcpQ domain-containing protein [Burkholderiaceae bacterium]
MPLGGALRALQAMPARLAPSLLASLVAWPAGAVPTEGERDERAPVIAPARVPPSSIIAVPGPDMAPSTPADTAPGSGTDAHGAAKRLLDALAREGKKSPEGASARDDVVPLTPGGSPPARGDTTTHRFTAHAGEPLSAALQAYLGREGWDLEWNCAQDFIVQREYALDVPGAIDLHRTLLRILAPYRLSAVIHNAPPQRVVAVTDSPAAGDTP